MKQTLLIALILSLSSCAAYKVVPESNLMHAAGEISLVKLNNHAQGLQCFEPMLYVLTLGIVPTHCVDTYSVFTQTHNLGRVKVISMQGWVALVLPASPVWKYGYGHNPETDILRLVQSQ